MPHNTLEIKGLDVGYGEIQVLRRLSIRLEGDECIGLFGPNGHGKTTLFKMITGQEKPSSGTFNLGESVKLAFVDQTRDVLDPEKSIWQVIADDQDTVTLGDREVNSRAYVARFNFSGADQQKKVGQLSGGERREPEVHAAEGPCGHRPGSWERVQSQPGDRHPTRQALHIAHVAR